jgi:TRAP-type C4-dicarboxylate transport system permease small subunit
MRSAQARRRIALAPGIKDDPIPVVENLVVWTAAAFGMISALATLAIVGAFVGEVIARWLGHPFDPTNLVSGLLVTAVFTGMAWTTIRGEHISVQFVSERFGARFGKALDVLIWALGSAYLIWLVIASFETAAANTWPVAEMVPDGVGLAPRWPWRWVLAIGMVPFALVALLNLARAILGRNPYDDVERPDEAPKGEAADALAVVDEAVAETIAETGDETTGETK